MSQQPAQIAVLPGDYIGPEIMQAGLAVLAAVSRIGRFDYQLKKLPFGGEAIDQTGEPLPAATLAACRESDAVLLAAIGGPKWDQAKHRPEAGLLAIRKALGLFANIRPTVITDQLQRYSPLKAAKPVDFVIVRELTSGIYFGQPREKQSDYAVDTMRYTADEIRRVLQVAFEMAQKRRQHVTLVDKANVLATSKLWRQIATQMATDYPTVHFDTCYVDAAAMRIIAAPDQFDVVVTENLFGDILSDEAAQITGSLGTIPSMSQGTSGPALYEPIHGSAPDIAGKGIANPLSMINSVAMMLTNSFQRSDLANQIHNAVNQTTAAGVVTPDLGGTATTKSMTEMIIQQLKEGSAVNVTDNVR